MGLMGRGSDRMKRLQAAGVTHRRLETLRPQQDVQGWVVLLILGAAQRSKQLRQTRFVIGARRAGGVTRGRIQVLEVQDIPQLEGFVGPSGTQERMTFGLVDGVVKVVRIEVILIKDAPYLGIAICSPLLQGLGILH